MEFQCRVIVQRRCGDCCSSVENIPLQAERHSARRQKLFAFPPESAFTFRPECCSDSHRNGVRLQTGIAFAFDRIPHPASYALPDEASAAFSLGFILGQTTAYLEQVNAGAKLAAQIGCHATHSPAVRELVEKEGCRVVVEERDAGRVAIWIFKHAFVETIIAEMSGKKPTPPNALEVWSMGKLFGYSDSEIGAYLQAHDLVTSASDSESNQLPCLRRSG